VSGSDGLNAIVDLNVSNGGIAAVRGAISMPQAAHLQFSLGNMRPHFQSSDFLEQRAGVADVP